MITLAGIVAGFFFFCFLIFISLMIFAPNGYEDEDGFHYTQRALDTQPVMDRDPVGPVPPLEPQKVNADKNVKTPVA